MLISDTGYPHDGRADNAAYRHDRRADKRRYLHDSRPVYNYVFCVVSTYLGFKIRSTDR